MMEALTKLCHDLHWNIFISTIRFRWWELGTSRKYKENIHSKFQLCNEFGFYVVWGNLSWFTSFIAVWIQEVNSLITPSLLTFLSLTLIVFTFLFFMPQLNIFSLLNSQILLFLILSLQTLIATSHLSKTIAVLLNLNNTASYLSPCSPPKLLQNSFLNTNICNGCNICNPINPSFKTLIPTMQLSKSH